MSTELTARMHEGQREWFGNAFMQVLWYDGYEDHVNAMIEYVGDRENRGEFGHVPHPKHSGRSLCVTMQDTVESAPNAILWECMVLMFGNYGTSPRFGWIERPDECADYLRILRRNTYGFEHYHAEEDGPPVWCTSDEEFAEMAREWEEEQMA